MELEVARQLRQHPMLYGGKNKDSSYCEYSKSNVENFFLLAHFLESFAILNDCVEFCVF